MYTTPDLSCLYFEEDSKKILLKYYPSLFYFVPYFMLLLEGWIRLLSTFKCGQISLISGQSFMVNSWIVLMDCDHNHFFGILLHFEQWFQYFGNFLQKTFMLFESDLICLVFVIKNILKLAIKWGSLTFISMLKIASIVKDVQPWSPSRQSTIQRDNQKLDRVNFLCCRSIPIETTFREFER